MGDCVKYLAFCQTAVCILPVLAMQVVCSLVNNVDNDNVVFQIGDCTN